MSSSPQKPDPLGLLQRVHQLGNAAESVFAQLMRSLRQKQHQEQEEALRLMTEQARSMLLRNERLKDMLDDNRLEVERLYAIFERVGEGIVMQDLDGRVVLMNPAAETMLGSDRNFWRSQLGVLFNEVHDISTIGNELELAPISEAKQVTVGQRQLGAQIAAITNDGGQRLGTLMILRDITYEDLSARMKDSFVTQISHELITPLAPIRMASEMLLAAPEDAAPNRKMLEMISRNVDILDRMVSDMLEMSAMTSGNFTIERNSVDIESLLWSVVDSFKDMVIDAKLDITVMLRDTHALSLQGDRQRLHWAFTHLIRNAVQYSDPNQHIQFTARLDRDDPTLLILQVIDTGAGISDDDLPHVYDLFYRGTAHNANGKRIDPRGLGQGLFVAKTITEAHGGIIQLKSAMGEGTIVTLTLPRNLKSQPELPA